LLACLLALPLRLYKLYIPYTKIVQPASGPVGTCAPWDISPLGDPCPTIAANHRYIPYTERPPTFIEAATLHCPVLCNSNAIAAGWYAHNGRKGKSAPSRSAVGTAFSVYQFMAPIVLLSITAEQCSPPRCLRFKSNERTVEYDVPCLHASCN
jgi:hypothetical protein